MVYWTYKKLKDKYIKDKEKYMDTSIGQKEKSTSYDIGHENETSQKGSPLDVSNHKNESNRDLEKIGQNIPYFFIRKKTEKLTSAVYMITGFLSDSEPIKWQMREIGLQILSDITLMEHETASESVQKEVRVIGGIEKIVSLFEIASAARFISEMNLAILKDEYRSLIKNIEAKGSGASHRRRDFDRSFFDVSEIKKEKKDDFEKDKDDVFYKNKTEEVSDSATSHITSPQKNFVTKTTERLASVSGTTVREIKEKSGEGKTSRQVLVLAIIKDKGHGAEVSIKDIAERFTDCGEKTIQRELTSLVEKGILKKTGDRRWSRYSLVTHN